MTPDLFSAAWFSALASIVMIDLILAGDNALVVDGAPRERIVLADWDDRGHYIVIDAGGVHDRHIVG